jgi:hypothetical protein
MRAREMTILVGVLIVLAGVYLLAVRPFGRSTMESVLRENLLFPELSAESADVVTIKGKTPALTLARGDTGWMIENGRALHADPERVEEALAMLSALTKAELVSIVPDKHAVFEVDDRQGSRVTVRGGGATMADAILGKRGPDLVSIYVRDADSDEVYLSQPGLASVLLRGIDDWRDRRVMDFAARDVATLAIETESGRLAIDAGGETGWQVREPEEAPANAKRVEVVLGTLGRLKASGFEDGLSPAECGFGTAGGVEPAATVTVELRSGPPQTVWIGGGDDRDRYVMRADRETVYRVSASTVEHILRDPADFVLTPEQS